MKKTIQAWKDEDFRLSLTEAERAKLPANPAGIVELTDEALDSLISGGAAEQVDSCCWSSCNADQAEF
jgi:mersacidin/lichenicidin family type 2 lantibiotic